MARLNAVLGIIAAALGLALLAHCPDVDLKGPGDAQGYVTVTICRAEC